MRGSACQYFYDDAGNVTETITIAAGSECVAADGGAEWKY